MDKFLFGTATAAHQVEGNNINSDYYFMENMKYTEFNEPSGAACDHYNRYKEDIDLMKKYNLNSYRFSIEWARIENEMGVYNQKEINHYIDVIDYCNSLGIEPIVTLHHFSSPKWLISIGGWENPNVVEYFKNYVYKVVSQIKDKVKYICTINEANMGTQFKEIVKKYKRDFILNLKNKKNLDSNVQVGVNFKELLKNMKKKSLELKEIFGTSKVHTFVSSRSSKSDLLVIKSHIAARDAIKSLNKNIQVGITLSLHDVQEINGGIRKANKIWNQEFSSYYKYLADDDFIGVQNYTRMLVSKKGQEGNPINSRTTEMGYEYYPESLKNVIDRVWNETHKPILVTENGIATSNDDERIEFIKKAITGLKESIDSGAKVIGYMYWSFLDNFEWQKGYSKHFGVVSVDRKTQKRTPKKSLDVLKEYSLKFNS